MFAYNIFNIPNVANYNPYELVFGRKPKLLLDLKMNPSIKVSGTLKVYYIIINKWLNYLLKLLQDFKLKRVSMINKDRHFLQYNEEDLVYIISPLTRELRTSYKNF